MVVQDRIIVRKKSLFGIFHGRLAFQIGMVSRSPMIPVQGGVSIPPGLIAIAAS